MNAKHGLPEATLTRIAETLGCFPTVERAVLFGSRAKGVHKPGSDIDLALVGSSLDWREVGRIYDALDDLMLPYGFSLIRYDAHTDPELVGHITRVGLPIYTRAPLPVG